MKKSKRKLILSLLLMICISCGILGGCSVSAENKGDRSEFGGGEVPITDLAATYKGNATDADGNLLAPFDVVYPEAFASGDYKYDETAALLKFGKNFDGEITKDLKSCGFTSLEKAMTNTDGTAWYRASVSESSDVKTAVKKARSLKAVLIADFDYIYEDNSVEASQSGANAASSDIDGLIDDVLSNIQVKDQWYLTSCNIQKSWRWLKSKGVSAGGDPSVTVAVIDTGVDYTHPDLKANMWVNTGEIPGNGIDDDGDGYIDDVYGCSTVSDARFHTGDPMDDHGHGTHVAGIIAAANNKVGTVGVAYNVKIMAVKAGQATGVFLQSDIAEAIVYAYTHGADVINMSFGGSACSIAVQDALQSAYTTSTLVAAAGNDGMPNEAVGLYPAMPSYPAALSYVVGVMSVNALGVESSFTNWDVSAYNSVEYEVYAPGEAMLSTLPDNRYGKLNGTSMATPLVSGIAALLRSYYTDRDMYPSKFVSAQLCATSGDTAHCFAPEKHTVNGMPHNLPMIVNAYDALTKLPKPDVNLYGYYLFDDEVFSSGNNGDGVIDAGETINIGTILRNRWGMSKNTVVKIDALSSAGVANPYVKILTGSVNFDGVGTYSTKDNLTRNDSGVYTGVENPLVVKVSDDCPNDYLINLNVTVTFGNGLDEADNGTYKTKGTISFAVRNGVVLPNQIVENMTLTKDNYYIIPNGTVIAEGVTVTVEPGTKIQFWSNDPEDPYADQYIAYLKVKGKFITNGTLEEPVELFPSELMSQYEVCLTEADLGRIDLNYTNVTNATLDISSADHCSFKQNYEGKFILCRILNNGKISGDTVNYSNLFCRVGTSNSNRSFKIEQCFNSVFYKLGYATASYNLSPCLTGTFDTCTFVDCRIYNFSSDLQNSVFAGNNINGKASFFDATGINATTDVDNKFGLTNIQEKNKAYVKAYLTSDFTTVGRDYYHYIQFAKSLGGDICCIETQEEAQLLVEKGFYNYTVGAKSHYEWANGEKIGDWFEVKKGTNEYAQFRYINGKYMLDYSSSLYLYVVLEIPGREDGTLWTVKDMQQEYADFIKNGGANEWFTGNAILNNFNDTNVEHWLRIMAQSGDENKIASVIGNYWGTTDIDLIEKQIVDYDDFKSPGDILVSPYLTTAPSNTFPFVTDAYVLNSNGERARTVSNETCTFVVEFNRDMDTTIPLRVRFGSSKPYAEYEISGKYVSARRWEGVYTLKTTIENGNQYFNIENARAADDRFLRLYETLGRFGFEIDTTTAQAMIMQGEATETGVKLTWQQDDFDTLLGYNVYRSDKEDGLYTRLNDYVLAADENEFFDSTVEPGKLYYYNFTVVKTDMQESTPSGKIVIRAMDTMAPNIYHSPVRTAYTGQKLIISATITDNLQISSATLYYRVVGGEWKSYVMYNNNSRYYGIVGAENISLDGLEYYIDAFDGVTHTYNGTADKPYSVTVKVAVDDNSLGDVDGDGVITNRDALMLLQAANDKLNLTEEQFMRADIDKDKKLSASEAMRILQYVSGKIGSIV